MLCACKDKRTSWCCTKVRNDVEAIALIHIEEVVRHCRFCFFAGFNFVGDRVLQVLAHQLVNTTIKSGREQKTLTFTWCFVEDARDVFEESKFSHVIGFIQHSDFYGVEFNLTRLHQVDETSWAGNNNVHT